MELFRKLTESWGSKWKLPDNPGSVIDRIPGIEEAYALRLHWDELLKQVLQMQENKNQIINKNIQN